jgi:hypothetical protein
MYTVADEQEVIRGELMNGTDRTSDSTVDSSLFGVGG